MGVQKIDLKEKNSLSRVKSSIGVVLYFYFSYGLCGGLLGYLTYQILINQSLFSTIILIVICTYQYGFSKRSSHLIRFFRWFNLPNYFNDWTCTIEEPIRENKALFSYHPHCIFNFTFFWNIIHNCIDATFLATRMLINIPILGLLVTMMGVESVDPQNMGRLMKKGKNIGVLPGGFEEACLTSQDEHRVYIKHRKGFIKYALQYGYTVYPCYSFGENRVYWTLTKFLNFRMILAKLKMPSVLFGSKFGIVPDYNVSMHSVVGKGIQCPQIERPTKEDVEKYHKIYIDELICLFNRYKKQFNLEKQELILY